MTGSMSSGLPVSDLPDNYDKQFIQAKGSRYSPIPMQAVCVEACEQHTQSVHHCEMHIQMRPLEVTYVHTMSNSLQRVAFSMEAHPPRGHLVRDGYGPDGVARRGNESFGPASHHRQSAWRRFLPTIPWQLDVQCCSHDDGRNVGAGEVCHGRRGQLRGQHSRI